MNSKSNTMHHASKIYALSLLNLFLNLNLSAQSIAWTDISSSYSLPSGIKVFRGERASPALRAFYLDADLNNPKLAIRAYLSSLAEKKETVAPFCQRVGAYAAINGGFFNTSTGDSYSSVVYPDAVKAFNIAGVNRTVGGTSLYFPVTRSFFGMDAKYKFSVDWIYHFGKNISDVYRYSQPIPNTTTTPASAPTIAGGKQYENLVMGIGGAPTLVKNSQVHITYNEEVMWGSGVGLDNGDPRTAVGYTTNNHVIMLVADGRQTNSQGVSLTELAQIMIDRGCVEAMNLDGGGSTQMAIGNQYVDSPSESRAVPSILAVVPIDSAHFPATVYYEKVIDSGDPECTFSGTGWGASNASGYWGTTKAQVVLKGSGNASATFKPRLPKSAQYMIYGWWVTNALNCKDTPYIIKRKNGIDTVRIDQSINASQWNNVGSFVFSGDSTDVITISNAATNGSIVCVDAIRIISYDSTITAVTSIDKNKPFDFALGDNFPNPFNPITTIRFSIPRLAVARLSIVDLLGREVSVLVDELKETGSYDVRWDASRFPSGVYFYILTTGRFQETKRMVLLK